MAISVGRADDRSRSERLERYAVRLTALAAYAAAVTIAFVLLAPTLVPSDGAPVAASLPPPGRFVTVRPGESLVGLAAANAVSLARLQALNPSLGPFGLAPGTRVLLP